MTPKDLFDKILNGATVTEIQLVINDSEVYTFNGKLYNGTMDMLKRFIEDDIISI